MRKLSISNNFSFLKACFIELKRLKRIKNLEPFKRYGLAAATCLIPSLSLLLAANHAISLWLIQVSTAVAVRHKLHNPTPFVRLRRNKRPGFSLSLFVFFSRIFCPVHYVSCVCVAGKELCGDCDTKATTSKSWKGLLTATPSPKQQSILSFPSSILLLLFSLLVGSCAKAYNAVTCATR